MPFGGTGTQQELSGRTKVVFENGSQYGQTVKRTFDTSTEGGENLERAADGVWLVKKPEWLGKAKVPGSTGYVPGGRFTIGQTYGLTTSQGAHNASHYTKTKVSYCNDNLTIGNPKPRPESPWRRKQAMNARFNIKRMGARKPGEKRPPPSGLGATRVGEGKVPGYAGFIRGSQQVHALPFGGATRRCELEKFRKCYEALANSDNLPPAPHCKASPVPQPKFKVPGYQGHVPMVRHDYAMTYAAMTTSKDNTEFKVPDRSFRCWTKY